VAGGFDRQRSDLCVNAPKKRGCAAHWRVPLPKQIIICKETKFLLVDLKTLQNGMKFGLE
jgi:hypothetical protein